MVELRLRPRVSGSFNQTLRFYPTADGEHPQGSGQERSDVVNSDGRKISPRACLQTHVQEGKRGADASTRLDRVKGNTAWPDPKPITHDGKDSDSKVPE